MKSSIKIDFIDRGTGIGIEPVIRIELIKSEDPRDTLLAVLFENIRYQSYLQVQYAMSKQVTTQDGYPDLEKRIYLFKPEINTDDAMAVVRLSFCEWAIKKGWSATSEEPSGKFYYINKKKETASEAWLMQQFFSERAMPNIK